MINEQEATVSWLTKEGADVVIKAQQVSITGEKQESITIAKTSEARGSGFPQMAYMRVNFTLPGRMLGRMKRR